MIQVAVFGVVTQGVTPGYILKQSETFINVRSQSVQQKHLPFPALILLPAQFPATRESRGGYKISP